MILLEVIMITGLLKFQSLKRLVPYVCECEDIIEVRLHEKENKKF